jgi:hypothetical protein
MDCFTFFIAYDIVLYPDFVLVTKMKCCSLLKKVKQSRYNPAVAQRVPGGLGSQIS